MATLFNRASQTYQAGSRQFGPVNIPGDTDKLRISLTRESWPGANGENIGEIRFVWSNGTKSKCSLAGGTLMMKDGVTVQTHSRFEVNRPRGTTRAVSVEVDTLRSITTAITVESIPLQ